MPKLNTESKLDRKEAPFTAKWDADMRANHSHFQNLIDREAFNIQKGANGFAFFGNWTFPYSYQKSYLLKSIYEKNQLLGQIYDEEIEQYSNINSSIRSDLNLTFNAGG